MQKIPHRSAGFFACIFFQCKLVREAGLEPARAYCTLEPESSESANSTTRACRCPEGKLVRVTGLEPVRRLSHAPQTCLSTSSSTLAFSSSLAGQQDYYSRFPPVCQPLFSAFTANFRPQSQNRPSGPARLPSVMRPGE